MNCCECLSSDASEETISLKIHSHVFTTTGTCKQVKDKFMYVPIMGSLASMVQNSEICNSFQKPEPHKEGFYRDLNDGSYF